MMAQVLESPANVSPRAQAAPAHPGRRRRILQAAGWLFFAAIAILIPFVTEDYRTFQFTEVAVFAVIVLGLNILTGYAGQISLAHGAFVLVGAYMTAILAGGGIADIHVHPTLAVVAGGATAAAIGVFLGIPALRLSGPYLAVATLGLAIAMPIILKSSYLEEWTHGAGGLSVEKPLPPEGFFADLLFPVEWQYFILLVPSVLLVWLAWNIRRSRVGRAFVALRDSEAGARMSGVNVASYKLLAFGVSAFYAGIGGGLLVLVMGFVSPDSFTLMDSINFLAAMVIGGLGSILGSILGGAFLAFQGEINSRLAEIFPEGENLRWALFGGLLIVLMVFAPGGIAGFIRRPPLVARTRRWLRAHTGSNRGPAAPAGDSTHSESETPAHAG
jgi:branched-chain amino acid transport system permease protein